VDSFKGVESEVEKKVEEVWFPVGMVHAKKPNES